MDVFVVKKGHVMKCTFSFFLFFLEKEGGGRGEALSL